MSSSEPLARTPVPDAHASRHRLARGFLFAGLAVLFLAVWHSAPRETEIEYVLGHAHRDVVELRVAYARNGEELTGARFGFPAGAPGRVPHQLRLPPGELEVRIEATQRDGRTHSVTRRVTTPADGAVTLALGGERP